MDQMIFYGTEEGRAKPGQVPSSVILKDAVWVVVGIVLLIVAFMLPAKITDAIGGSTIPALVATSVIAFGFLLIGYHAILYRNAKYLITDTKIQRESGIISKEIEHIELYKVLDIHYKSLFGRGIITIESKDSSSPELVISVPDARDVFHRIEKALPEARQRGGLHRVDVE